MRRKNSVLLRLLVALLCLSLAGGTVNAADSCELVIKRVLDTGTPDQITAMLQASARLEGIAKAGFAAESDLFDHVGSIGKSVLDVVDANLGSNPPVTVHDFIRLLNNPNIPDAEIPTLLKELDSIRDTNRNFLPGVTTKPGPPGDGSTRYILTLAGTPNAGVVFEANAAVFIRDVIGEQLVGMGGRAVMADGTIFEGDVCTLSPQVGQPGFLKLWDAKNANGQSSLTVDKVTRAKNAVLQGAPIQLGPNTYVTGEVGFAIEEGGSISPDVQTAIDQANLELQQNNKPIITVRQHIP